MLQKGTSNSDVLGAYVAAASKRDTPAAVADAARLCLADWMGVALGARDETAGRIVRQTAEGWRSDGGAMVLFGGRAAAPFAALANGTLAHCLDFDDTYVDGVTHTSAPVWAATLALGEQIGASEEELLAAFITGFEVSAAMGRGMGQPVTARGWHGTGAFGRLGAAAASAALLKLNAKQASHALAAAATQISGLTASFGTMAKPFHAGKAAMDGVLAAQLAKGDFVAAPGVLEPGGGLAKALVQDGAADLAKADFSTWRILENSFKPYAACHLTHPAVDAAKTLRARGYDAAAGGEVRAGVWPLAAQVTGQASGHPTTPLEGKFDLKYCIALALHGHDLSAADFREPWQADPKVCATADKVRVLPSDEFGFTSARLEAATGNGEAEAIDVPIAKGHPGNPIGWDDMWSKFNGLVAPRLGNRTAELFEHLRSFGKGSGMAEIKAIVGELH